MIGYLSFAGFANYYILVVLQVVYSGCRLFVDVYWIFVCCGLHIVDWLLFCYSICLNYVWLVDA